jgi:hypothetical protein
VFLSSRCCRLAGIIYLFDEGFKTMTSAGKGVEPGAKRYCAGTALGAQVCCSPITSFHCAAEVDRYRGIVDIE